MATPIDLQPVDAAEVTILVDNFVDLLLAGSERVRRAPMLPDLFEREALIAEHGYALLLTVERDGRRESLLYDAGLSRQTILRNLDVLEQSVAELRAVVLSHGHDDHHGGLEGLVQRVGRAGLPLVLHPDAWRIRRAVMPTGAEIRLPPPSRNDLEREGVAVIEERGPSLLIDGAVLVTGQVERLSGFEPGLPPQQMLGDGGWEPDPWVWDDQAIVSHVKERGLVVLSGCSHAGIVNVLWQARRLTGVDQLHAIVGGMHLGGGPFEPIIPQTVQALVALAPDVIVPGHCTGWKATHELARRLPDAYVQTSVGTRLRFA